MPNIFREKNNDSGYIRVYPGKLGITLPPEQILLPVTSQTTAADVIRFSLHKYGLPDSTIDDYRLVEVILDKGGMLE